MTKKEFVEVYKNKLRIKSTKVANQKINNFWNSWLEILEKDKSFSIRNFGRFEIKNVRTREGVSPYRKFVTIPSKKIRFIAGKKLKEMLK